MTLLSKCGSLQTRVDYLKNAQQSVAESSALSERLAEASALRDGVQDTFKKIAFLKENGIEMDTSVIGQVDPLAPLNVIIERFAEKPEAASLTRGKDWTKLQDRGAEWQRTLQAEAFRAWKGFIDRLGQGQSPDGLRATLAQTETNKRALQEFTVLFNDLKSLRNEFPAGSGTVAQALHLSEELKRIGKTFDYDVPKDVKVFLAAINQGGASLDLLTEDVLTWLRENQSESDYQIVGKR